jgi:itaconate CoA-transferase
LQHREALRAVIEETFATLKAEEIETKLEGAQIAHARMNSVREVIDHPQLTSRSRWTEIGSEAGPLRALPPPVAIEGVEPVMGAVPALGQHTSAILQELGFADDVVANWKREKVI